MRSFLGGCFALVCAFVFAGPVSAQNAVTRTVPVDENFAEGGIKWSGAGGGYEWRIRLISVDGGLELCGVLAYDGSFSRSNDRRVLRATKLTMNGKPIIQDFNYFAKVEKRTGFKGAVSNCARTSAKTPTTAVEFDIETPRKSYKF